MVSAHCRRVLEGFEERAKEICWDFREIRAVVMCRAWEEMEARHIPFREAIKDAWEWAKEKCAEVGAYI